jgi:hypothetical protein
MNINVSDKFFMAVEEYNNTVKNPEKLILINKMSFKEKKGLFFTVLRRHFDICKNVTKNYSTNIKVDDIECLFNVDHTILKVTINKSANFNEWFDDSGLDKANTLYDLKKVTDAHQIIYPTKELNELSQIFSQL